MTARDDGFAEPPEPDSPARGESTRTHVDPLRKLRAGARLADRYRIEALLGVGGMGMVYKAADEELDMDVAIKVLRPEYAADSGLIERFRRELLLGRQVSHRHVVRIHDIGRDGELLFITMDLVEGRSLRQILDTEGRMSEERAVEIARQLAGALAAAHAEGVVHRDLKPSNLLLDDDGRVYITDFGIARSLAAPGLTRTGAIVGTPDYLSPEQARGEEVDGRSDLYALGLILFEMLTGRMPFPGGSVTEVLAQRISGRAGDPSRFGVRLSPGLAEVLHRCLRRSPERRYQTAGELARDLDDLGGAARPRRRRRALAALAVVAALAAGVWGVRAWRQRAPAGAASAAAAAQAERPAPHTLALLPFEDQTGLAQLAWLASAVPEMTAERLAESARLTVVDSARLASTLERLKLDASAPGDATLRQLAELFDADRIVTGKVRTLGERLRVDAQIVRLEPGATAASETLTAEAAEPVELVAELSTGIRELLSVPPPDDPAPTTDSPEALAAYGEAMRRLALGDALAARPLLERAVELDPEFGPAWLRLGEAYGELGNLERAATASERAVRALGDGSRLALLARARQASLEGEPGDAEEILERLVDRFPNDLESAVALAEARADQGELAAAIATLEPVVTAAPNHPRAWYLMAKFAILDGDSRKAVDDYLVRAMVIQNRLKSDPGRAEALNAFGAAYTELGDLELAIDHYGQAAELRERIGDRRGYATSLRNLAQVHTLHGAYDDAERDFERALAILEEIGDTAGRGDLLNSLGFLDETRGRSRAALERYRAALAIRRDSGDRLAEAESLNNVGYAYYLLGENDNASVYWQQALDLYRDNGNRGGEAQVLQSLAQLQLARGRWDEATRSHLDALELAREIDFLQATAVSLGYLGQLARLQGRYAAALASYDEALALLEQMEDPRGLAEFGLGEAATLVELGREAAAGELLTRIEGWLEAGGSDEQRARWLRLRAALAGRAGEHSRARTLLEEAARAAASSESAGAGIAVRIASGIARLEAGDASAAAAALAETVAEADRADDFELRLLARDALAAAQLEGGDPEAALATAERALRLVRDAGLWAGAWRLQRQRAAALERLGRPADARAASEAAAAERKRLLEGLSGDDRASLERTFEGRADAG